MHLVCFYYKSISVGSEQKSASPLSNGCEGFTVAVMENRSVYLEIRPVSRHHLPTIRRCMHFIPTTLSRVLCMSEDFREVPKIAVFLNTFLARRIDGVEVIRKNQFHIPTVCGWMPQCPYEDGLAIGRCRLSGK